MVVFVEDDSCRWADYRDDDQGADAAFVDLSFGEQQARGRKLMEMLQVHEMQPAKNSSSLSSRVKAAEPEPAVRMLVKRTFIELVASPCERGRPRALTDSALDNPRSRDDVSIAFSETSTEAPSDAEEAAPIHPPGHWVSQNGSIYGMTAPPRVSPIPGTWIVPDERPSVWSGACWMPMTLDAATASLHHCSNESAQGWGFACADTLQLDSSSASTGDTSEKEKTTVVLRNLPSEFTRAALLEVLEDEGLDGSYDFVYMPVDFSSQRTLGYAFVSFVSAGDAQRCWQIMEGFIDWGKPVEKACEICWSDPHQGLQAHIERYRNSPVMHESVPDEWRPVIFAGGARVMFPHPTKAIKAPKIRCRTTLTAGKEG